MEISSRKYVEQLPRCLIPLSRLDSGPIQQWPELRKRHAVGTERQRAAAGAVGKRHCPDWFQGFPITQFHIVRNCRSCVLGIQQILPKRDVAAMAVPAHLGEKPFQVLTHFSDDFGFIHGHDKDRTDPQVESGVSPSIIRHSARDQNGIAAHGSSIPPSTAHMAASAARPGLRDLWGHGHPLRLERQAVPFRQSV